MRKVFYQLRATHFLSDSESIHSILMKGKMYRDGLS